MIDEVKKGGRLASGRYMIPECMVSGVRGGEVDVADPWRRGA